MANRKTKVSFDPQEVILLGILARGPTHGYEVKRIVEEEFEPFAPVKCGTVYYTLGKLHEQGYVTQRQVAEGTRPPKLVYSVTPKGRKRLKEALRESLHQPDRPFFAFDIGLFFIHFLGYEAVLSAIADRKKRIEGYLAFLSALEERHPDVPFNIRAIKERSRLFIDAGRSWYEKLEKEILARAKREARPAPGPETVPTSLDLRFTSYLDIAEKSDGRHL